MSLFYTDTSFTREWSVIRRLQNWKGLQPWHSYLNKKMFDELNTRKKIILSDLPDFVSYRIELINFCDLLLVLNRLLVFISWELSSLDTFLVYMHWKTDFHKGHRVVSTFTFNVTTFPLNIKILAFFVQNLYPESNVVFFNPFLHVYLGFIQFFFCYYFLSLVTLSLTRLSFFKIVSVTKWEIFLIILTIR